MVEIEFFEIIGTSLGAARRRDPKPCLGIVWRAGREPLVSCWFLAGLFLSSLAAFLLLPCCFLAGFSLIVRCVSVVFWWCIGDFPVMSW